MASGCRVFLGITESRVCQFGVRRIRESPGAKVKDFDLCVPGITIAGSLKPVMVGGVIAH